MKNRLVSLAIVASAFAFLLAAWGGEPTPTSSRPTTAFLIAPTLAAAAEPTFDQQWQKLIKAAQKEGELVLAIGGGGGRRIGPVLKVFEKKFGIAVKHQRGRSRTVANKLLAEQRRGLYSVDGWASGMTTGNRMADAGAFTPLLPHLIHPDVADKSRWIGDRFYWGDREERSIFIFSMNSQVGATNFEYNTNLVDLKRDLKSHWDILNPKYKGKIVSGQDPRRAGGGSALVNQFLRPEGREFIKRLWSEMGIRIIEDVRLYYDGLAKGSFVIGLGGAGGSSEEFDQLVAQGAPMSVTEFPEEITGWRAGSSDSMAMMNRAPHPNATKLFINWYLSSEGWHTRQKLVLSPRPLVSTVSLRKDATQEHVRPPTRRLKPGQKFYLSAADPKYADFEKEAARWVNDVMVEAGYAPVAVE